MTRSTSIDRDALQRCVDLILACDDASRVEQVQNMLQDKSRPWRETAEFCSYVLQTSALELRPWDEAPCHSDGKGDGPADKLAAKLIEAGLSTYEPDPVAVLKARQSV